MPRERTAAQRTTALLAHGLIEAQPQQSLQRPEPLFYRDPRNFRSTNRSAREPRLVFSDQAVNPFSCATVR